MSSNPGQKRLRFDRVEVREVGDARCRVEVTFTLADRQIQAHATGSSEGIGPLKAAATATLNAIVEAVEGKFTCELVDLDHVNALGKELIAVLVDVAFEGKQVQVFGSCQLAGSEIDAAVKAALNATNRFFELAMRS
jgi:hypothetical protein